MRLTFLVTLAYLTADVFAGGYQGCLERVMLFYAYQIDELNDPKERSLGYKCDFWDAKAKKCMGKWVECKGRSGGRCNFNELMASVGKSRPSDELVDGPDQNTKTPDVEGTAIKLYNKYTGGGGGNKVANYPPHRVMKGGTDKFLPYIQRLGGIVNEAAAKKDDNNKALFEGFDDAVSKLNIARAGDHGPHLVSAARNDLGSKMDIVVENLGKNPATGQIWETVNWEATEDGAGKKGVEDHTGEIERFKARFYSRNSAREHLEVMRAFEIVGNEAKTCR